MTKEVSFKNADELKKRILSLEKEEVLSLDFPREKANALQLLEYKMHSCENLFNTFMRSGAQEGNDFSLKQFIDCYTELVAEHEQNFRRSVNELLSPAVFAFMNQNGFAGRILYDQSKFIIFRKPAAKK